MKDPFIRFAVSVFLVVQAGGLFGVFLEASRAVRHGFAYELYENAIIAAAGAIVGCFYGFMKAEENKA